MQSHWQPDKERLLRPTPDKGLSLARPVPILPILHRILSAFFLVALPTALWLHHKQPAATWPLAILLGLTVVSTFVSQCRSLPFQNVLVVFIFILVIAGIIQTIGTATSIPFGPYIYADAAGDRVFDVLPWPLPLVWAVVILNCRGVARLLLRPWRKVRTYGFRLIGLTGLLTALFALGLDPFATRAHRMWVWQESRGGINWFGAPWINFFAWGMTTLLILVFTTPWLINKKPVKRAPDYHPLFVWLGLNLFFAATLAQHHLWLAAGLTLTISAIITHLAVRNAQW